MTNDEFEKIKTLINKATIQSAKNQGAIDSIKASWMKEYGTDDLSEIQKILAEKKKEYEQSKQRLDKLINDLNEIRDWDELERNLS